MFEPVLSTLLEALKRLPGVGAKSAQRIAFHLLQHDRAGADLLAQALTSAVSSIGHCARCHTFTEFHICPLCEDPSRDHRQLCVVETPADQAAVERTGSYFGLYFVLMGRLSPLDGIGPQQIGVPELIERASDPRLEEVILATNFTAEGEATAHALSQVLKSKGLRVTRLARGVPAGGELEYVDLGTIAHAFSQRH